MSGDDQTQNPGRVPHLPRGTSPGEAQLGPRDADSARGNFERFARGEPIAVDVGEIERELGSLWQEASHAGGGQTGAVARAALWNLVIPARGRDALARTKALVDAIAPAVPVRAITLCLDDAAGGGDLSATIESNVVSQPGGGRMVYSEEITLVGPAGSEAHFGAMVRALQVPGVRTATLWMDAAMPTELLTRELLPVTRRLIVDTASCSGPLQLQDLDRLAARMHPRPVADLGWLRLSSFRLLFAGLFDPPVGGGPLRGATRLAVRHRSGGDVSAFLVVAWLGQLLGWEPLCSAQTSDGGRRFDFDRPGGGLVEAFVVPTAGACDQSAILAIELASGSDAYVVQREAIDQARLQLPIAPARAVKLDTYSDADICVAALGPRGRDPLFARCLAYAGRLWALGAGRKTGTLGGLPQPPR
jgi:glucose-6-phosphate dehydrogenase assembly protein OpcA